MDFTGKRILVTGAGKGIGNATAKYLAARGATVVAATRSSEDLAALAKEIYCETFPVDLEDQDAAAEMAAAALPVDGLVNCAGITIHEIFLESKLSSLQQLLAVNTLAPYTVSQVVARDMVKRGIRGSIVNVSSIAAKIGFAERVAYCASKSALDGITRVLAIELGEHGIRVNSINPAITLTPMAAKAWGDPAKANPVKARMPLGRFIEPEEVAATIAFLLSDESSMTTGQSVVVDGGMLIR